MALIDQIFMPLPQLPHGTLRSDTPNILLGLNRRIGVDTMSGIKRKNEQATVEIEQIRHALGTVATAEPAVFWVYLGRDRLWRARREGEPSEKSFANREAARAFVKILAARCRSYRLFIQDEDGGFVEESAGWPANLRRLISAGDGTSIDPD
jgi:hypothetical protein